MFLSLTAAPPYVSLFPPVSFQGTRGGHHQSLDPRTRKTATLRLKKFPTRQRFLCPMTSFAKKLRPGTNVPRSCQSHTARAVLGRRACFRWRLTSAKEAFHDRQTALWTSSIYISCTAFFFLTYSSAVLCAYAQPP